MEKTRQDAWSNDEDRLLAEIVLKYISEGKTQLEAFKEAAHSLSRTPAACGFRWNASIRKQYLTAIETAKNNRKRQLANQGGKIEGSEDVAIDSVITLLERVKASVKNQDSEEKYKQVITSLTEENTQLQHSIKRYQDAWLEMGRLWQWIHENNKRNEH